MKKGITLSEVLITLAIIGIITVLIFPTLQINISNKIKNLQMVVFKHKLQKGTDLLNINNGVGPYYNSSYAFVKTLSQYMKISDICTDDNLSQCLGYEVIHYKDLDINVADIKSGKNFGLNVYDYPDVAGVIFGDGTPMLILWNTNCPVSDPDILSGSGSDTTSCIKGFVDINGAKSPNKVSSDGRLSDIIGFGISALNDGHGSGCLYTLKGKCVVAPPEYRPMKTSEYCDEKSDGTFVINSTGKALGIKNCCINASCQTSGDLFAGAANACGGVDNIVSMDWLIDFANELYGVDSIKWGNVSNVTIDSQKLLGIITTLGLRNTGTINSPYFGLWASEEVDSSRAQRCNFKKDSVTCSAGHSRATATKGQVLCFEK